MLLRELRGLPPVLLIGAGLIALFVYIASSGLIHPSPTSHRDLIEYWAAYRLLDNNPYSPTQILQIQNQAGAGFEVPLMMWNPPWLPLLMPGIHLPFPNAWLAWRLVNLTLWLLSGVLLMKACNKKTTSITPPWLLFILLSAPGLLNLQLGQMGSFLTFGAALVLYGWVYQLAITFGAGVLLLSVKPHIFMVFGTYFLMQIIKSRRWKFALIALLPLLLTCSWTYAYYPHAIPHWISAVINPPEGAIDPRKWMTPTIGRWADILMAWAGLDIGTLLSKIILAAGLIVGLVIGTSKKLTHTTPLPALTALIVSILASPFSWTFDQMVLILPQTALLATIWTESESIRQRWIALLAFAAINMIMVVQWISLHAELQFYVWFPIAQTTLCWLIYKAFLAPPRHQLTAEKVTS